MYPLLAIYLQLYGLCAGNGIDPGNIAKMLQGRDSKIMETDRAMWDLADEAKRLGIADLFEHEPEQIRDALSTAGGNASIWLTKFDDFLKVHGWRTEGIADINIPSWIENQASPLGQLAQLRADGRAARLRQVARSTRTASATRRSTHARSQLNGDNLGAFNELLGISTVANFAWWNEEHNYYIDLRASIPMRRGALAAAEAVGADTYDDTHVPVLPRAARGRATATSRGRTSSRSPPPATSTTTTTRTCATTIPKVVGTLPDKVEDPGADRDLRHAQATTSTGLKADPHTTDAQGLPGVCRHVHRARRE